MLGPLALLLSMAALPETGRPTSLPPYMADVPNPEARQTALSEFEEALEQYALLHRRLERERPPKEPVDDPAVFIQAAHDLANAIRNARPDARAGDIFTPGPARMIRQIITQALQRYGYDARDVIRVLNDERLPGAKLPVVNGRYDRRLGAWMWPALLQALPPLPQELEYRIVDADLVLIDLRADLVVDILENAMPVEDE